ncbi:helix-turn-helix domain-containing protein [Kitasatospora sp. NPDC048298]|uniref:helix-turn-helix domain-containing protein n=1 Tax=Kitasatospora sp. NPDC048298 TaxID=3364049 RepID=UPI00371A1545
MAASLFDDGHPNTGPNSLSGRQGEPEWSIPAAQLGVELRELRGSRTQGWVASRTHMSISKLSRIECGHRRLNDPNDIAKILDALGLRRGPDHARLMELAQAASIKSQPGFHRDAEPEALRRLSGMVSRATLMISMDAHVVPGLLQTEPYMVAVTKATLVRSRQHRVAQIVDARLERQRDFLAAGVRAVFFVHQSALYRAVGSHEVMVQQMEILLEWTETAGVGVRIIPVELPLAFQLTNVTRLVFGAPGSVPELIYVEQGPQSSYYYYPDRKDSSAEFEDYKEVLDELLLRAPGRQRSRELIREAIEWHRARL